MCGVKFDEGCESLNIFEKRLFDLINSILTYV